MPKLDLSGHALINNQSPPDGSKTKVFIDGKLSENVNYLTQICPAIKSLVFLTKFAFRGKKRKEANYDGNDTELACQQLGQFFYLGDQSTHLCGSCLWCWAILCRFTDHKRPVQAAGFFILRYLCRPQKTEEEKKQEGQKQRKQGGYTG